MLTFSLTRICPKFTASSTSRAISVVHTFISVKPTDAVFVGLVADLPQNATTTWIRRGFVGQRQQLVEHGFDGIHAMPQRNRFRYSSVGPFHHRQIHLREQVIHTVEVPPQQAVRNTEMLGEVARSGGAGEIALYQPQISVNNPFTTFVVINNLRQRSLPAFSTCSDCA